MNDYATNTYERKKYFEFFWKKSSGLDKPNKKIVSDMIYDIEKIEGLYKRFVINCFDS